MEVDTVGFWLNGVKHAQGYVQIRNVVAREVHKVGHENSADRPVSDDENVVLNPLNLSNHIPKAADNLQVAFTSNTWVDVVELVSASLRVFFWVLCCDLLVSLAFEDAW